MRIYGFLPVWNESDWIDHAIRHSMDHTDFLVISEGYFGPPWDFWTNRSHDGTIEKIQPYRDRKNVEIIKSRIGPKVEMGRARTFRKAFNIFKKNGIREGDWIMLCDPDEFYTDEQMRTLKKLMKNTKKDYINLHSRNFVFNFTTYFPSKHIRFWRYIKGMNFFWYNQYAVYADGTRYEDHPEKEVLALKDQPFYHYSFVRTITKERERRKSEVKGRTRKKDIYEWIDNCFAKWNEKNAKKLYEQNKKLYGIYGFFPGNEAILHTYTGPHPRILDDHPYRNIKDVRKLKHKL